ncbi:hypothetical protein DITRI_Ditri14bG0045500 [Diplodiscus trichospermus]
MELNISFFLSATLLLVCLGHAAADNGEKKAYIVYMGDSLKTRTLAAANHHSLLSEVTEDEEAARQSIIHSYGKSFNAFAAYLSPDEAERLQEKENVVSVFPNTIRQPQTTRSWDFLGMPLSVERNLQKESDIIVGVLDTGIYMDVPSFDDKGFGPPPAKWKGTCQLGANFSGCNNKVIGARAYNLDPLDAGFELTPADVLGHGSHTASTIAGNPVQGANVYGLGEGTARGGVPSARIAVYKVCIDGCSDMNLLAAMDDAIDDGVDVLSLSIGGFSMGYFRDAISIGAFHAMKKGILTSCSAGNDGPGLKSMANGAPWILTVGASATDRVFRTPIRIGNHMSFLGSSTNTFHPKKEIYPLTSGAEATKQGAKDNYSLCDSTTLDKNKVKGKIVYCNKANKASLIKSMGGIGVILGCGPADLDAGFTFAISGACVDTHVGDRILQYINSTKNPQAVILKSIEVKASAPFVAAFSSRGPYRHARSILKPDIVAPGVEILAGYTQLASITGSEGDNRFSMYHILSGTSMSCPHATAVAAYVKSFHPEWSPSAIKSALMTTTSELRVGDEFAELAYGAGQIDPVRAVQPGLVYEMFKIDYIRFLCNEGYRGTTLRLVVDEHVDCSSIPKFGGQDDLNYPSMLVSHKDLVSPISAVFYRTVTNVGHANSTYNAIVKAPAFLNIKVIPNTLVFTELNEKKSFKVKVKGPPLKSNQTILSASLEWTDSFHRVRSPIVIHPSSIENKMEA